VLPAAAKECGYDSIELSFGLLLLVMYELDSKGDSLSEPALFSTNLMVI
jgi:hypothetical protein